MPQDPEAVSHARPARGGQGGSHGRRGDQKSIQVLAGARRHLPLWGGKETVKHFLWSCPLTWSARNGVGGELGNVSNLPAFQQKLGIPALDHTLRQWQESWRSFTHSLGAWTSNKIWTDASSFYPRDGALRVVGWACVAWLQGGWAFIRGTMPPGTTVAQGEARAIQVALDRLEPGGVIASDFWAAV